MRKRIIISIAIGLVVAVGWVMTSRFMSFNSDAVHYHANFALYVNGQRDEFSNFTFYEEVQACSADDHFTPKSRAHMHDQINNVVHVHDKAATWADFFKGLGYDLSDSSVKTDAGNFVNGQAGKLDFVLNGKVVTAIADTVINSEDTLLVNFGSEQADILNQRFAAITKNAGEYNSRNDPSTCTGSQVPSFKQKLLHALKFWQ